MQRLLWGGLEVGCLEDMEAQTGAGAATLQLPQGVQPLHPQGGSGQGDISAAVAAWAGGSTTSPAQSSLALVSAAAQPGPVLAAAQQAGMLVWCVGSSPTQAAEAGPAAHGAPSHNEVASLKHIPRLIARHQAEHAEPHGSVRVVGHAMKFSREKDMSQCTRSSALSCEDAASRGGQAGKPYTGGLLALAPQQGLVFAPIDLSEPLDAQQPFHVSGGRLPVWEGQCLHDPHDPYPLPRLYAYAWPGC